MVDGDELPFSFLAVTVMIYSSVGSRLRARLSLLFKVVCCGSFPRDLVSSQVTL